MSSCNGYITTNLGDVFPMSDNSCSQGIICTSLQTARYCEMYPVTNYTMEIKELSSGSDVQSFASVTNCIVADDLLENVMYMFRITAWNSAGSASSDALNVCKLAITF